MCAGPLACAVPGAASPDLTPARGAGRPWGVVRRRLGLFLDPRCAGGYWHGSRPAPFPLPAVTDVPVYNSVGLARGGAGDDAVLSFVAAPGERAARDRPLESAPAMFGVVILRP